MKKQPEENMISPPAEPGKVKKNYINPRIISVEPLEIIASVCSVSPPGKTAGFCGVVSS
jgi:hypothetical protein